MMSSAMVGGVVDERYIHQRARCLGSGERCTSRIAHRRMVAGGTVRPAGKARCLSAGVITFTRPRAWFLSITRLGNQRDLPVLHAQLVVVAGELFDGQLPVHGDGGGSGCQRWFRRERGGIGVGDAGGEWASDRRER